MEKDRVQFSSVTQSCLTLCNPMDCSTPGLPVHHQLPEFNQTHVHWVGDAILSCRPLLLLPSIFPSIRVFSKWIKDLNVRPEVIKLSEENIGRTLNDINQSKILYDPPLREMEIKTKVNKWDLITFKSFCTAKETISKVKREPLEWEKIIANETTDQGLISKIYISSSYNSIPEKQTTQSKSGQET